VLYDYKGAWSLVGEHGGEIRLDKCAVHSWLNVSVSEETNRETKAEPQQIVAQGYSHAYSTSFLS
jgi:hypothetical protein